MKLIKKKCEWDFHYNIEYYWIENNDLIMKCLLKYQGDDIILESVYVFE